MYVKNLPIPRDFLENKSKAMKTNESLLNFIGNK